MTQALQAAPAALPMEDLIRSAIENKVNADALEKLVLLQERVLARQSEQFFAEAMQRVQAKLRPVLKNRRNTQTDSNYVTLEALNRVLVPIYTTQGFALSFGTDTSPIDGFVRIVCDVSHAGGHTRRYHYDLPLDNVGIKGTVNKTGVQASGSTLSYGRRYLSLLIFNVSTTDDDDGNAPIETVSDEQAANLQALAEEVAADVPKFCRWLKVERLSDIPAAQYSRAVELLEEKRKHAGGK